MRLSAVVLAAALSLSASLAARADILYQVTVASPSSYVGSYTFTELSILTSGTTIYAAQFTSSTGDPLSSIFINPAKDDCDGYAAASSASCLTIIENPNTTLLLPFFPETLTSLGVYSNSSVQGVSLSITDTTSAVTPEPSSLILLATGLLGLTRKLRRRGPGPGLRPYS